MIPLWDRENRRRTISGFAVTAGTLVLFSLYLCLERWALKGLLDRIPLRIGVTGARGKSSVVRMITSILKESHGPVLAKTTGSQPVVYLPDGTETTIKRRGPISILEQKRVLKSAVNGSAQTVVMEMMSIRPESLWVEAHRLLQPDLLVITNFRRDHREHWGDTRAEVLSALRSAITPGCSVIVPEEEDSPGLQEAAAEIGTDLALIPPLTREEMRSLGSRVSSLEFEPNPRLAVAVAEHLGIARELALRSLDASTSDRGGMRVWCFDADRPLRSWYFANAFAANEPESSRLALEKLQASSDLEYTRILAVLNLRSDRPDRTLQWAEAVQSREFSEVAKIYVTGGHGLAFKRKVCRSLPEADIHVLRQRTADGVFAVLSAEAAGALVLGVGNLGGLGGALVELCRDRGVLRVV